MQHCLWSFHLIRNESVEWVLPTGWIQKFCLKVLGIFFIGFGNPLDVYLLKTHKRF